MQTPITSATLAVRYARNKDLKGGMDSPFMLIWLNDDYAPIEDSEQSDKVIAVVKGKPEPTPELVEKAQMLSDMFHSNNTSFIDFILVGDNAFYSFAEEKTTEIV